MAERVGSLGEAIARIQQAQRLVARVTGPVGHPNHMERLNQLVREALAANEHTGDIAGEFLGMGYDLRIPEAMLLALPPEVAATYQRQT